MTTLTDAAEVVHLARRDMIRAEGPEAWNPTHRALLVDTSTWWQILAGHLRDYSREIEDVPMTILGVQVWIDPDADHRLEVLPVDALPSSAREVRA